MCHGPVALTTGTAPHAPDVGRGHRHRESDDRKLRLVAGVAHLFIGGVRTVDGFLSEGEHLVALSMLPRGISILAIGSYAGQELALYGPAWPPLDGLDARFVDGDADRVLRGSGGSGVRRERDEGRVRRQSTRTRSRAGSCARYLERGDLAVSRSAGELAHRLGLTIAPEAEHAAPGGLEE